MPHVKAIQMCAQLQYHDGYVVVVNSPACTKNIRHGEFFSNEEVNDVLENFGHGLAELIKLETPTKIYTNARAEEIESNYPKPKIPRDGFDPLELN